MAIFRDIIRIAAFVRMGARPAAYAALGLILLSPILLPSQLAAQVTTLNRNDQEKRPTPRDPRYIPPSLPDYLRRQLERAPGAAISPSGEINAEAVLRAQGVRAATTRRSRHESKGYSDSANTFADRLLFSESVLRQFGIDALPPRAPEVKIRETESRRFQVVYFLSLPYTLGISYAVFAAGTNQLGGRVVFNGPETAGFISVGLIFSGFVAWYDNRRWLKVQAAKKAREKDIPPSEIKTPKKSGLLRTNDPGSRAFALSRGSHRANNSAKELRVFSFSYDFRF